MFHFSLLTVTSPSVLAARARFPAEYVLPLEAKPTFSASIVARQAISQIARDSYGIPDFLPLVNVEGVPVFSDGIYWSISHSGDRVLVAVSDRPVGVDVERIKSRDDSLFSRHSEDEWWTMATFLPMSLSSTASCAMVEVLGEGVSDARIGSGSVIRPNWPDFYRLWTAKESIIKAHLGKLDDMESLVLSGIGSASAPFDRSFSFVWHSRLSTYSAVDGEFAYAVTVSR